MQAAVIDYLDCMEHGDLLSCEALMGISYVGRGDHMLVWHMA